MLFIGGVPKICSLPFQLMLFGFRLERVADPVLLEIEVG